MPRKPARRACRPVRGGPIIQTVADHKARPLGNWQSDNAVDIGVPAGTDVLAVDDGEIVKVSGSPPRRGAGVIGGFSITLRTSTNQFFYAHLLRASVQPGDRVKAGQVIGASGFANNVEHLHIAEQHGDPTNLWGNGAPDQQTTPLGGCDDGAVGPANLGQAAAVRAPQAFATLPAWAMAGNRAPAQIDARIVPDALWILRTYQLRVTAGREVGHASHGDGTALDLVPADTTAGQAAWDHSALRFAHDIGWTEGCAAAGVAPACPLKPWVRFVGYNGYPDHGDPAHVGANAHIHVSWLASASPSSGLAPPNEWVRVFPVPASLVPAHEHRSPDPPRPEGVTLMASPEPNVPSWPVADATVHADGTATLTIHGAQRPVTAADPDAARAELVRLVREELADELGRPVRLHTVDPDGTEGELAVAPDGTVTEITRARPRRDAASPTPPAPASPAPAGSPSLRVAPAEARAG